MEVKFSKPAKAVKFRAMRGRPDVSRKCGVFPAERAGRTLVWAPVFAVRAHASK